MNILFMLATISTWPGLLAFDWGRVGTSALIGGLIGGAVALVAHFAKKRKGGDS